MGYEKYTVLIVDDEEVYRKFLKRLIEKEIGARVEISRNPKEAFEYLKKSIPDLILLDMQMPMMDGLSALKLIRSAPATSNIPVIPCTAMGNKDLVIKLKEFNISDYILKSGDAAIYKNKILKVLASIEEFNVNKNRIRIDD